MNSFVYTALTHDGKLHSSQWFGQGEEELQQWLAQSGSTLLQIKQKKTFHFFRFKKLSLQEQINFFYHLKEILKAGLSLPQAIEAYIQITSTPRGKSIAFDILSDLQQGETFNSCIRKRALTFNTFVYQMLGRGQLEGELAQTCELIYNYLKWHQSLNKKVLQLLRYPFILFSLAIVGIFAASFWIAPQTIELLASLGIQEKTWSQNSLLWLNHNYEYVFLLLSTIVVVGILLSLCKKFLIFQKLENILRSKIKFLHFFQRGIQLYQMASLLDSGLTIQHVLNCLQNAAKADIKLSQMSTYLLRGATLHESFSQVHYIDAVWLKIILLAEQTGELPKNLRLISHILLEFYYKRIEQLIFWTQPFLLIIIGLIFVWIIHATIFPLYESFKIIQF